MVIPRLYMREHPTRLPLLVTSLSSPSLLYFILLLLSCPPFLPLLPVDLVALTASRFLLIVCKFLAYKFAFFCTVYPLRHWFFEFISNHRFKTIFFCLLLNENEEKKLSSGDSSIKVKLEPRWIFNYIWLIQIDWNSMNIANEESLTDKWKLSAIFDDGSSRGAAPFLNRNVISV